ncbi:MAG TPA: DUF4982 domain-containing protein [Candidatus Pullilachnospira intestinigallinarum]|nr:DUF4982 domain-containing protein [Candidatus Pullilachnospira intestinigallinarum]
MQRVDFSRNWSFYESDEGQSFVFDHPAGHPVDLPHDFIIGKPRRADAPGAAGNGYFGEGQGVYKKILEVPPQWEGKTILLDIDGAYMNAEVSVNQELLLIHPNGYIPFQVDITPALWKDKRKNLIKIITQSRQPSSRWYSGGGLYRDVCLWVGGPVYVKPWDFFITTPTAEKERALVRVEAQMTRTGAFRPVTACCRILDGDGVCRAEEEKAVEKPEDEKVCFELTLPSPRLWDLEDPYLYRCEILLKEGEGILDTAGDTFGIRNIQVDAVNGFRLNGRRLNLKGGCIHHDNGFLGACAYPKAEKRKLEILKRAGYNTVRISHYPPSLALLKLCDEMGMLLMDEAFDVWRLGKVPMDYHQFFEAWWERDIECMVKRDRNHPSVITYSIGNEITERDGCNNGAAWSRRLADKVRSLDATRFVISALCGVYPFHDDVDDAGGGGNFEINMNASQESWGEVTAAFCEPLDIVGYNYLKDIYESTHQQFPDRVMLGTETHAYNTWDYWEKVKKLPYVIGDCIWAAVDYLGEVGAGKVYWERDREPFTFMAPYPWRSSWQSDIDLTGEQRPQSVYRQIMWGDTARSGIYTTHPCHYGEAFHGSGWHWPDVMDSWTFEEQYLGKPVRTEVYGAGDEAEFFLNGESLGRVPFEKLKAAMDIPYQPGELEAVVLRDGKEISRCGLKTAGRTVKFSVVAEEKWIAADGRDLGYLRILAEDASGIRCVEETCEVTVQVEGSGSFVSMGSGNPCTEDQITEARCHLYRGSAIVIVKGTAPGTVRVKVRSGELSGEGFLEAR